MITQRDFMRQEILLNQKIGLRLSRAGMLSKLFANQIFAKNGAVIRPEQFTVLYALKENNGMFLRQLANITFKDRPNMTRIVTILENNGYVTSALEAEGRQVKKLYITEKGSRLCEEILPTILQIWQETAAGISEEEINNFLITLNKIESNMREKTIIQV